LSGAIEMLPQHPALERAHDTPLWVRYLPLTVGLTGIALAYGMYQVAPSVPGLLVVRFRGVYHFLIKKWYFDELYDFVFVRSAFEIGRGLWRGGDGAVIDGVGPDGVAAATLNVARGARRIQTGYIFHYAFAMLIGILVLITWYLFRFA
jgi:NADH-quinone oxidoreductase subunit L